MSAQVERVSGRVVLAVDDDSSFLASLVEFLADEPYDLVTAADGREALEVLRARAVDLVVTDIRMPREDGFAVLAGLFSRPDFIPSLVMTAYATPDLERRVKRLGVVGVVGKPVDPARLRQEIGAALDRREDGGRIRGVALASFLQLLAAERKTCTVKVTTSGDSDSGLMFFRAGELLDATTARSHGERAVVEMLGWDDVDISLRAQCRLQDRAIASSLESVLLDAFRKLDEAAAGRESPEPAGRPDETTPAGSKENAMALEKFLEDFKGIKGYLAVGIMDSTGELLAFHEAEKSVNLEVTGAVFNDIFRGAHEASVKASLETCRQMSISTPKGLIVMECSGAQAAVHLHMIAVLQADGNQALARMTMDKAIKGAKDSMA